MEVKKSEQASLQNKRLLFTEIGFVIALLAVLFAFEWSSTEKKIASLEADNEVAAEEEIIPITQETPPPPVSAPKVPVLSDQIEIIADNIKIDDIVINTEDDVNFGVDIQDYVEEQREEAVEEEETVPFAIVEQKPLFQGRDANTFSAWVNKHLEYPEAAMENGIQGRVMMQFTVNTDGSVTNIRVINAPDPELGNEAARVVAMSPKWTPGRQRDRAVKVVYTFPVIFQLR